MFLHGIGTALLVVALALVFLLPSAARPQQALALIQGLALMSIASSALAVTWSLIRNKAGER